MNMKRIILALSGGIDSATMLAHFINIGYEVNCVGFMYGSKHNKLENAAAQKIADYYDAPFELIDVSNMMKHFKSDLLKTGGLIPKGHYAAENMKSTVVPARNMIFISILSGLAVSLGINEVAIGVHTGDHSIYPDCRKQFIQSMNVAVSLGTDDLVHLMAPFINDDKKEIVQRGIYLKVPYNLTRTCYTDQILACGMCGSCVERLEAFNTCGNIDPINYFFF